MRIRLNVKSSRGCKRRREQDERTDQTPTLNDSNIVKKNVKKDARNDKDGSKKRNTAKQPQHRVVNKGNTFKFKTDFLTSSGTIYFNG